MSTSKASSISQRLFVSYFLIAFTSVLIITGIYYYVLKESIIERTLAQLSSINVLKKTQIEDYFETRRRNLEIWVDNPEIQQAIAFFSERRPTVSAKKSAEMEQILNSFLLAHQYSEMVLLDTAYNIIYPLEYGNAHTATIVKSAHPKVKKFMLSSATGISRLDVTNIPRTGGETNLLIGVPVSSVTDEGVLGIMILKKDFIKIDQILHERAGMGSTGESYIVAEDLTMRSSSRFFPDSLPSTIVVNTQAVQAVIADVEQNHIIKDYRGITVLSAHSKLNLDGLGWMILSEIDLEEALQPLISIRQYVVYTFFILMIFILWITLFISGKISKPILKLRDEIERLSEGKLPKEKMFRSSSDEIGQMTDALNHLMTGLKSTAEFAYKIGKNDLGASFEPLSDEDVLGLSLLEMRQNLRRLKEREKKLNRQRSAALIEGQEKERRRFAMEIHDGLGQVLAAIKFKLSAIKGNPEQVEELKKYLNESIEEVRRISHNVMPAVLMDFGVQAGLQQLCKNIEKYSGLKVNFIYENAGTSENPVFDINVGLYRIAQEALNNTVKYADASHAEVSLRFGEDMVSLTVMDNGTGFDIKKFMNNSLRTSNGIKNMKERARLLNGTFDIKSSPEIGTVIKVDVPLYPIEKEDDSLMED